MNVTTKAIIILSITVFLLLVVLVFGLFNFRGSLQERNKLLEINSTINGQLISIRTGQEKSSRELGQLRERERNRLEIEREMERREKAIIEREEQLDIAERERIDRDRESIRRIRESENDSRKRLDRIRKAAGNIERIIQEVMEK